MPAGPAPHFEEVSPGRSFVFLDEQFDALGFFRVVLPPIDQVIIARQVLENELILGCHRRSPVADGSRPRHAGLVRFDAEVRKRRCQRRRY